jgi:quercetin dioxygenase-like cupin family protein
MSQTTHVHHVKAQQDAPFDLGIARMRLLAASKYTGNDFGIAEFEGDEGPWTVPHVHKRTQESFYVQKGYFTFEIGGQTIEAGPGDYVLVPKDTPHILAAGTGGGTVLTLWVPGGLEDMFIELSQLSPDSIRDPKTRAEIAKRHDSIPL